MKKTLLVPFLLVAFASSAQTYQWQWAKKGGALAQTSTESDIAYGFSSEQILDIAVDSENNYYFVAFVTKQSAEYEGSPLTTYNWSQGTLSPTDVVLISTDCSGALRWTQTIGGGSDDDSYKISVDNNGGLYLNASVLNFSGFGAEYAPPHFSPTNFMPTTVADFGQPQEGWKTGAILKYNTSNGSLAWRVMPQGDVNQSLRACGMSQIVVHQDGTLSSLVGFRTGIHANGLAVVSDEFNVDPKYFILRLNANGTILSAIDINMKGYLLPNHTDFRYDENLQRYYVAGFGTNGDIFMINDLWVNGIKLEKQAFMLAFSNTGQEIWRKEMGSSATLEDNRIYDLQIDSESNLYLCGKYFRVNPNVVTLGTYQFPTNLEGNINYVLKMNPAGEILWTKVPTAYNVEFYTASHQFHDMAINGDEIAIAGQADSEIWDNFPINRPPNFRSDPILLRLNKNTGTAIGLHDIMSLPGYDDGLTAVAADKDGNYVVGGYFYTDMFTLANDNVPTIQKVQNVTDYTDFFMAKLAASPCGTLGAIDFESEKTRIYPNPTSSVVNIEFDGTLESYEIVSVLGQVLAKGNFNGQNSVSVENLSNGVYILNLKSKEKGTESFKIVKN
ncbi:T9SS type A sorting domain-containing protein [Flavobacterium sp.]|uniref:T9SS type A sorting domain-containing protein n=1 Tax=Flavobacterium sp. TaxID=239 RepID=UPI001204CEE9|nr:T9SS type A sorting domain-containing protein [Flavobacterium sp.]RZJ70600.1 MAG: T9SS type A sorting domain-containing protein [Flavobacterium sp.]